MAKVGTGRGRIAELDARDDVLIEAEAELAPIFASKISKPGEA